MKPMILLAAAAALMAVATAASAADAAHGQKLFRQQCGVCHEAGDGDGDGGMGPSLKGVIGRKVAGDPMFSYTPALQALKGVWTEQRLADFLENPSKVAPGTAMGIRVPSPTDRADIAAYLASVK